MKQNTVRIQNNGAKGSRLPQVKTRRCKPAAAAPPIPEPRIEGGSYISDAPVTVTIQDYEHDVMVAGCDITPQKMQALRNRAQALGTSVGALLEAAVNWAAGLKPGQKVPAGGAKVKLVGLESAVQESQAFMQLLCDKIEQISQSRCDFSGAEVEHYVAGICALTFGAKAKLWTAFCAMHSAVHGATVGGAS